MNKLRNSDVRPGQFIFTVRLRFSPRFGFVPVARAFANSQEATAELAGFRSTGLTGTLLSFSISPPHKSC